MPRLPMNFFKFPATAEGNFFEAARKSGDVKKGDIVRFTGVDSKGRFAVELPNGQPSEHWHPLDAFYPNKERGGAANDNAQAQ